MLKGNAIIGQSGGPTSVINASLAGVVEAAQKFPGIGNVLGMRWGIEGFMAENIIDLGRLTPDFIAALKQTPSSALGSSRHKLKDADLPVVFEVLKKYDIRYFFLIGGNDTMDTIHRVEDYADSAGLRTDRRRRAEDGRQRPLRHRPHARASRAPPATWPCRSSRRGMLARDMQKVDQFVIFQTVGRSAGWLPAAAALAKKRRRTRRTSSACRSGRSTASSSWPT